MEVLKAFLADMNRGAYRKAYRFFSAPLRGKMTYGDFHEGATHVKSIQLVSARLVSDNRRVAKARVTLKDLEKYHDERNWRPREYTGDVVFVHERGGWRFIQVVLQYPAGKHKKKRVEGGHDGE